MGEIFTNDVINKCLISKIYEQLTQLSNNRTVNPIQKWAEDLETFLQRRHIDGQQAHEKMFNITNCYRNASQNYSGYHLTPEWPSLRSLQITDAGEGVEKREPSCTVCGDVN